MIRFRRPDDSGAAVVESVLITPIALLLLMAVFEFGLVFRDYSTVGDAVGDATRMGSIQGNKTMYIETDGGSGEPAEVGVNADYNIVRVLREGLGSLSTDSIERIVVFRAQSPGAGAPLSQVPAACRWGSASSPGAACNLYFTWDAFTAVQEGDASYFRCEDGEGVACGWPPTSREDGPQLGQVDYIGVYVRIERPYVTQMFGDVFTIEQASIARLEPGMIE